MDPKMVIHDTNIETSSNVAVFTLKGLHEALSCLSWQDLISCQVSTQSPENIALLLDLICHKMLCITSKGEWLIYDIMKRDWFPITSQDVNIIVVDLLKSFLNKLHDDSAHVRFDTVDDLQLITEYSKIKIIESLNLKISQHDFIEETLKIFALKNKAKCF